MKAQIWIDQNGNKFRVNPKRIHEYVNCKIECRDVTEEEIVELRIPEAMVTVLIPLDVFLWSQELQQKIAWLDLIYNGLDRRTLDGYVHIENIDTHDVPEYLSMEEYMRMKNAGVIFPPEIIELYENVETPTEENLSNNSENEEQNNNEEETEPTEEIDD